MAYAPGLRRTAYLVVHDWHLAEDLTQQAMAKLYVVWRRIRAEIRLAYVRRIVVNESLSPLRRKRPESPTDAVPDQPPPTHVQHLDLGQALDLLPPRQRAIVALRFLERPARQ